MSDAERNEAVQTGDGTDESPGENFDLDSLKNILEGLLLAAARPLSLDQLQTLMGGESGPDKGTLRRALQSLEDDCAHRGVELVEVASGFRFQVRQELQPWVTKLWEERPPRYSRALLETLALIAYRQPITRGEIEDVRGVSVSTNIIRQLEEREWIRVVGHRDVPGKPALFGTTKAFLDYFGLKNLDDLPSLAELRDIDSLEPELDFSGGSESKDDQPEASESGATDEAEAMALAAESAEEDGAEVEARQSGDDESAGDEPASGGTPAGEDPDDAAEAAASPDEEATSEAPAAETPESDEEPIADESSGANEAGGPGHSDESDADTRGAMDEGTESSDEESLSDEDESPGGEAASAGRR